MFVEKNYAYSLKLSPIEYSVIKKLIGAAIEWSDVAEDAGLNGTETDCVRRMLRTLERAEEIARNRSAAHKRTAQTRVPYSREDEEELSEDSDAVEIGTETEI